MYTFVQQRGGGSRRDPNHKSMYKCAYMYVHLSLSPPPPPDLANKILQNLSMYMLVNKLHINLEKCCYMKFKPISNTETNLEDRLIKIGETPIKQVSETKFLGIIIDDKLT